MEVRIISEQDVRDIVLSILSEEMNSELWCEDNSIRMDIKNLQEQVNKLNAEVKQLKHIAGWVSGYDDNGWPVEKSLASRVKQLEQEVKKL